MGNYFVWDELKRKRAQRRVGWRSFVALVAYVQFRGTDRPKTIIKQNKAMPCLLFISVGDFVVRYCNKNISTAWFSLTITANCIKPI